MRSVIIKLCVLVGANFGSGIAGLAGTLIACYGLWTTSNLCGLPVFFTVVPLGAIVGGVLGWRVARRYLAAIQPATQ